MWTIAGGALAAALFAGCFGARTVDCGDGFLCPAGTLCAEPGVCGAPTLVEQCFEQSKQDFERCDFSEEQGGVCLSGVCNACTVDLAGCSHNEWTPMTSPLASTLRGLWIGSPTRAFTGGTDRVLLEYDGRTWTPSATFPTAQAIGEIVKIWGSAPEDLYVVTASGQLWHFDGAQWRDEEPRLPMDADIVKAVSGTAANDVWAVGRMGTVVRFNGTVWKKLNASPGYTLNAATVGSKMIAVGQTGAVATSDGTVTTSSQPLPAQLGSPALFDVTSVSDHAIAVGAETFDVPTIVHYDGTSWTVPQFAADVPAGNLGAVWSATPEFAFAGGGGGRMLQFQSTMWILDATLQNDIQAIHGSDENNVFAVGTAGSIWRRTP